MRFPRMTFRACACRARLRRSSGARDRLLCADARPALLPVGTRVVREDAGQGPRPRRRRGRLGPRGLRGRGAPRKPLGPSSPAHSAPARSAARAWPCASTGSARRGGARTSRRPARSPARWWCPRSSAPRTWSAWRGASMRWASRPPPTRLQALIETAAGLQRAGEIAASSPRLDALMLGYLDLAASLGRPLRQDEPQRWLHAQETAARGGARFGPAGDRRAPPGRG